MICLSSISDTSKAFKVIIAGSRGRYGVGREHLLSQEHKDLFHSDYWHVLSLLERKEDIQFVTGACPSGADQLAYYLATNSSSTREAKSFPADWDTHKRAAGMIRNSEMAKYADALILFWDGKSPGSKNMLECAKKEKLMIRQIIK